MFMVHRSLYIYMGNKDLYKEVRELKIESREVYEEVKLRGQNSKEVYIIEDAADKCQL